MKCPYTPIECEYVDTAGMYKPVECADCKYNSALYLQIHKKYPLQDLMNMLPKTIIKDRKNIFRYKDVFDLSITKDALDNWVIAYNNERNLHTLFVETNKDIHRGLARILATLIESEMFHIKFELNNSDIILDYESYKNNLDQKR
jgi:hypothetical protein